MFYTDIALNDNINIQQTIHFSAQGILKTPRTPRTPTPLEEIHEEEPVQYLSEEEVISDVESIDSADSFKSKSDKSTPHFVTLELKVRGTQFQGYNFSVL